MRRVYFTILLLQLFSFAESQIRLQNVDSLKSDLDKTTPDTTKVLLYSELGFSYTFSQPDSAIRYAQKAILLVSRIPYKKGEAAAFFSYGWALWSSANYDKAIEAALRGLNLYKDLKDDERLDRSYVQLAVFYRDAGDPVQAIRYGMLSINLFDSLSAVHKTPMINPFQTIASIYVFSNQLDSASLYGAKSYELEKRRGNFISGYTYQILGGVEFKMKHYQRALDYYYSAIHVATTVKNNLDIAFSYSFIASLYQETGLLDSSIWYAKAILNNRELSRISRAVFEALSILTQDYRAMKKNDSTLKYMELQVALNESMFNKQKAAAIQNLTFSEELRLREMETAGIQYKNQLKLYAVFALSGVFLLVGIVLYRNNKVKQKANVLLQQQKDKVENTLKTLEATQSQLVQSEKMASLGELTAGIAHEIQNPLNFVNNFSELNTELIDELQSELKSGKTNEAFSISNDIKENEQKINHHGKRADSIVKAMLQHSRSSTGLKEPTDINALADEYLKLSYHGLRAKDKTFNATMQTDYDQSIGNINIIPQDMGRVFLNLYNNAFYAVSEKEKQQPESYEPTVSVRTRKTGNTIEISVKDNGNGIPQRVLDKIFQPFFSTKPTGQGTGLGLSLSYDVLKAHGGEIKVETKEGEGAEFILQIPAV
jgi:two-component system, NtrC family, sensor kinase